MADVNRVVKCDLGGSFLSFLEEKISGYEIPKPNVTVTDTVTVNDKKIISIL